MVKSISGSYDVGLDQFPAGLLQREPHLGNPRNMAWRFDADAPVLGRMGTMEVRLARNLAEMEAAQALRYKVFYGEMSAIANPTALATRRDVDHYDPFCDHLVVVDHVKPDNPDIVATYRLMPADRKDAAGGFYTAAEFDVLPLIERRHPARFLELGRSCVAAEFRNKRTMELLWHGLWRYILDQRIDVMIGCASLEGTNPDSLIVPLSFLFHQARAPAGWRVRAQPDRAVNMNRIANDAINHRRALAALPPLMKGYLRLGAYIGDDAVIDHQFGTTDVLIIMPVENLNARYVAHYGADASRYAAS